MEWGRQGSQDKDGDENVSRRISYAASCIEEEGCKQSGRDGGADDNDGGGDDDDLKAPVSNQTAS